MAADPGIQKPGKKFGPCVEDCKHRDCAESRFIVSCVCRFCDKPIGYETRFYLDHEASPATSDDKRWVHADCLEDDIDRQNAATWARTHHIGCVCGECSVQRERDAIDPRMGARS